jgi:hypothetical protein
MFSLPATRTGSFGIGGEASIFLPKPKLLIDARIVEFGARNRTQGLTFLLSLGWQVRSLAKTSSP